MTPERVAELRARYPSVTAVAELADEVERLTRQSEARLRLIEEAVAHGEEAARQRDALATKAQIFQDQRDGALGTMRAIGNSLGTLSTNELMQPSGQEGWAFVAYSARQLRIAAGPGRGARTATVRLSPTATPGMETPASE